MQDLFRSKQTRHSASLALAAKLKKIPA